MSQERLGAAANETPKDRKEYLARKKALWAKIESVDPEKEDMDYIAAEKAALEAYEAEQQEEPGGRATSDSELEEN